LSAQALSHTRPRPGPTPPPSAREGARGRWGEARANPCSKEDEAGRQAGRQAGRPSQGPPPSAREGVGAEGAGKSPSRPLASQGRRG
jgi:hypothetical protein